MENYKSEYYNPETFEKTEIETKIPVDLVEQIHRDLNTLRGYFVTPTLINPDDKDSVVFGIMDMNDKTMKYKVTITSSNQSTFNQLNEKILYHSICCIHFRNSINNVHSNCSKQRHCNDILGICRSVLRITIYWLYG